MAANNIGVPKRISAPNTIERVGIGNDGSDPSAPKPKHASPAFTFGGAGSNSASQHGRPKVRTTSQVQAIVTKIVDYDNKLPLDELEGVLRRRYNVTQEECSTTQLPVLVKRAKQELRTEEFQIQQIVEEIMDENEEFSVQEVEEALRDKYAINEMQYTSEQIQQDFN